MSRVSSPYNMTPGLIFVSSRIPFSSAITAISAAAISESPLKSNVSIVTFSRPWSALDRRRSWETIRERPPAFLWITVISSRISSGRLSCERRESHCISITDRGVRSSWDTSEVNCFSRFILSSICPSILSKVAARRYISSLPSPRFILLDKSSSSWMVRTVSVI